MKKFLLIILLVLFDTMAFTQVFSVSADKNNVLYIGVDNPLSIVVEKYNVSELIIKADKGELFGGAGTKYIYRGSQPGVVAISIADKYTGKEIGKVFFRAKYIPDPVAKIGPSTGGRVQKPVLMNQQFIRAEPENFDFDIFFKIESFTAVIIKKDSCFYREIKNQGNKFNEELTKALLNIEKNDMLIFKDIFIRSPDGRDRFISPAVFSVTE